MYEVILYAAVATIVCIVLYSVLGKSAGQDPSEKLNIKTKPKTKKNTKHNTPNTKTILAKEVSGGLNKIKSIDASFTTPGFIDGAKAAYSMILEAFAEGDKETLKTLLTSKVYKVYTNEIKKREEGKLKQVTDLVRLLEATVKSIKVNGKTATIEVVYKAELSSALFDGDNNLIQGDPDLLALISETWSYKKDLTSTKLNWLLSDVSPNEGDILEADPTPDTKK
ncbi:Tim44/TimA family putative adaptor protein [Hellea sp.]|nr:Tim44/TimA family putative adaptor protein [Hellea sp.]